MTLTIAYDGNDKGPNHAANNDEYPGMSGNSSFDVSSAEITLSIELGGPSRM